ncbi:MAG: chromosome segregation protein SMC [Saprospiraceae bacterium]|uniref:Chromosome partition protein Smc n=1 Tax=Candidatus Opimibacter skivensis TaxID=2982028 RepID=A0A9D7XQI9_9BACT|nr:chromosome segregation protein SMC [Candidatus Opimibacter skivensis]
MRLKSLELKGFKSFANDTLLHFDEDVIGIVGPNGSGKSNVVDAIRWVLGEQKGKELRLENMGDVIFNGTKKRKASAAASVAITFDNNLGLLPSEYQEVVISRHLYRSGESEYKLNGVTCRLKDIQSILIDTGIGSNSYAIIALGMVDDILYDKDNARRKMFEQAAGISKYKKRKHETMLKLKLTSDDLIRIDDILKEIQTNLELLEKQAKRTRKFVELKSDYKSLSLTLGARNNFELRDLFAQSEKKIQDETDNYSRLEADLSVLHAHLEKLRKDHLGDELTVGSFQRELNELVANIRTIENEKSLADQKIVFIRQNKQNLETQISMATKRLEKLNDEILSLRTGYTENEQILNEHLSTLTESQHQRDEIARKYEEMMSNREAVSNLHQQFEKEVFDLEKNIAVFINNADIINNENKIVADETQKLTLEHEQLKQHLQEEEEQKELAAKALAGLEEQEMNRMRTIRELEIDLTAQLDHLRQTQRTLDARTHEAELLKDMISNLEGFPESIKFLNKTQDWNVTAPLLSDVIYCDQQHRVIVEQILEPYLNYYVVNTWDEAARAVKLLSFAQKGRANFCILSEYNETPSIIDFEGLTPLLANLEIEHGYESLVRQLLHKVYVTEGSPLDINWEDYPLKGMTVIDKQAQMIRRSHQLAGGSIGLFEGKKLGRKKHLDHLEQEIITLRHEWHQLQSGVQHAQAKLASLQAVDISAQLQSTRSKVVGLLQSWAETNSRLSHVRERKEENDQRHHKNNEALREIDLKIAVSTSELEEKKTKYRDYAQSMEQSEEHYYDIQRQLNAAEAASNEIKLQEIHLSNKLESLGRELKYHIDQQHQLQQNTALQQTQIESESIELENMIMLSSAMSGDLQEKYIDKKNREITLTEVEQNYYEQRNQISAAEEKIKIVEKQRNALQYLINEMKDNHSQLKYKLIAISERMEVEFGVRLEDITAEHLNEELPLDELEAKVLRLRNRLENYGEINPMAIEAYEEIKIRYDNINNQRQDVLSAKESLLSTITEIELTATSQFMEAFDKVRENFIEVFRSLFTDDDTCDLILMDPTDPLESAIDIIAKPKGKRPKSLSQLSGGEKTLTAIALLFALYLMKPAPFCVFDEVDAPLDDANIQKFNKIIKRFSAQSQFIIVTHNKTTMAAVDTIYGVFMEEQGISGLSQVDFRAFDDADMLALQN